MKRLNFILGAIFSQMILIESASGDTFGDFNKPIEGGFTDYNVPKSEEIELGLYGVEVLTSWRSEYVYRGFLLAQGSMEFQLVAQWVLSESDSFDAGVYYGIEAGDGGFSELTGFAAFSRQLGKYRYSAELAFHEYGGSFFDSGVDFRLSANYQMNEAFDFKGSVSYDTGAEGFYFESKVSYYEEVNDVSYVTLDAGISSVAGYYDRDGLHHGFAKLGYTRNISESVSVSPYITGVFGIHNDVDNHVIGGVYFAVSF